MERFAMEGNIDVLGALLETIPYFVNNVQAGGGDLLMTLYEAVVADIILNFDSARLYLTLGAPDDSLLWAPICAGTPPAALRMIIWLIESRGMEENIRNSSNRIHFRGYNKNVYLDTKRNEIRCALFCDALRYMQKERVLCFLIEKLVETRSSLAKSAPEKDDFYLSTIIEYRLRRIIEVILLVDVDL
jgi:hypothetical protein